MPVSQLRDESRLHVRELLLLEQPAALVQARVLPRRHCIVVTVGFVRALIFPERVYLFGPTSPHVAGYAAALAAHVAGGAKQAMAAAAAGGGSDEATESPFEFVVVEHALMTLVARQGKRVTYARRVLETLLARLGGGGAADDARTLALFPLAQTLSHYEMVSRGICESVRLLLEDDRDMREMCLTAKSRASLAVVAAAAARARDEAAAYDPPRSAVSQVTDMDAASWAVPSDDTHVPANGVTSEIVDSTSGTASTTSSPMRGSSAGGGTVDRLPASSPRQHEGSDAYLGYSTSPIASHRHLGRVLAGDAAQAPGGKAARAAAASDAAAAARLVWSGVEPGRRGRNDSHSNTRHRHGIQDGIPANAAVRAGAASGSSHGAGEQLDRTTHYPGATASDLLGVPAEGVSELRSSSGGRHALPAPYYMGSAAGSSTGTSLGSLGYRGTDESVRIPLSAYAAATPDQSRLSRGSETGRAMVPAPPPALLLRIAPDVLSQLELMLEGVFHSASETVVGLVELARSLRSKLDIVELQQSTLRNELLGLSLRISALGVSLSAATFVTSAFGMNLPSGLESGAAGSGTPVLFLAVTAVSTVVGLSTFRAFNAFTHRGSPAAAHARRLAAFQGFLLRLDSNVDAARSTLSRAAVGAQQQQQAAAAAAAAAGGDGIWRDSGGETGTAALGQVVSGSGASVGGGSGSTLLTKAQFKELHEATSGRKLDDEETTLLFELFDADSDGRIRLDEALDSLESTSGSSGNVAGNGSASLKLRW